MLVESSPGATMRIFPSRESNHTWILRVADTRAFDLGFDVADLRLMAMAFLRRGV